MLRAADVMRMVRSDHAVRRTQMDWNARWPFIRRWLILVLIALCSFAVLRSVFLWS
jgi:hypothetical protein